MADDTRRIDETVPGGKYLAADRKTFVDAWGRPLKDAAPEGDRPEATAEDAAPKTAPRRTSKKG